MYEYLIRLEYLKLAVPYVNVQGGENNNYGFNIVIYYFNETY